MVPSPASEVGRIAFDQVVATFVLHMVVASTEPHSAVDAVTMRCSPADRQQSLEQRLVVMLAKAVMLSEHSSPASSASFAGFASHQC